MIHLFDTTAFLGIREQVPEPDVTEFLNQLTDLIRDGQLTFPREVVDDLQFRAKGEVLDVWIKAVSSDRLLKAVPYSHMQWVMGKCPELCDADDPLDPPSNVAAFARCLDSDGEEFHVVSADTTNKPTRISLSAACVALGWGVDSLADFMACVGI